MAEQDRETGDQKLYTLSQISQKTKISMPTLQRYKKLYQNRIPSVGSGRKQRYPESAMPVFHEIKRENIGRRGRPRKDASAGGRRGAGRRGAAAASGRGAAAAPAPARRGRAAAGRRGRKPGAGRPAGRSAAKSGRRSGNLLTLTQVSEMTHISYPTLVRYVRLFSDRLPHEGKGRARRFHPEAVPVFRELRQQSGRGGRKPGSGAGRAGAGRSAGSGVLAGRLRAIEKAQQGLEKRFKTFVKSLQKLVR
jgi:hypothetical protein